MLAERVVASFKALSTGDAVAKQTETLPYSEVPAWYPGGITGFHGRPGDVIPRYRGKRYEWKIGETTDDTEQTLAVAKAILEEQDVRHISVARELLKCTKSLHPGVSLWSFVQTGDASRIARDGDGCGAATRVSPVGVLYDSSQLDSIVRGAYECAIPTHGGQSAICAAAAVAAAVSASLDGCSPTEVLSAALAAAEAANAGGDSDSVASIGGAVAGALRPETVNERWFDVVSAVNQDDIVKVALSLAAVRRIK